MRCNPIVIIILSLALVLFTYHLPILILNLKQISIIENADYNSKIEHILISFLKNTIIPTVSVLCAISIISIIGAYNYIIKTKCFSIIIILLTVFCPLLTYLSTWLNTIRVVNKSTKSISFGTIGVPIGVSICIIILIICYVLLFKKQKARK
jgi:hypothetical protein